MEYSEQSKVTILTTTIANCVQQERAIKDEENGWVRAYWVFYGVLATIGSAALHAQNPPPSNQACGSSIYFEGPGNVAIVVAFSGLLLVMAAATRFFLSQMLAMRHSYYGVRQRMLQAARTLRIDDPAAWGAHGALQPKITLLTEITSEEDYQRRTLPDATFRGRIEFLMYGYVASSIVLFSALLLRYPWKGVSVVVVPTLIVGVLWAVERYPSVLKEDRAHFLKTNSTK